MAGTRRPYDDASSATQMASDCEAVEATMRFPHPRQVDDLPGEVPVLGALRQRSGAEPSIEVSDDTARLAQSLHLTRD